MRDLTGQVAWITGAGSGIGEAVAYTLAGVGCRVVLSGRRVELLDAVAREIRASGGEAHVEVLDVSDQEAVAQVAARIIERHERIDIGVFSAGHNIRERNWPELDPADWDSVIGTNLDGVFYCCHAVVPHMRQQGDGLIVNVSSLAAHQVSLFTGPAYSASKHALNAMTESLLLEERQNGIRASLISPGAVNTPIARFRPQPATEESLARALQPVDLANLVLFVAQQPPHVVMHEVTLSPIGNRIAQP